MEDMTDWLNSRTRINTVGELKDAINKLADGLQMPVLGFYDAGFGIARDVSVGIEVSLDGERFFAIDVEDERPPS